MKTCTHTQQLIPFPRVNYSLFISVPSWQWVVPHSWNAYLEKQMHREYLFSFEQWHFQLWNVTYRSPRVQGRERWLCVADCTQLSSQIKGSCKVLMVLLTMLYLAAWLTGLMPYFHWSNYCHYHWYACILLVIRICLEFSEEHTTSETSNWWSCAV